MLTTSLASGTLTFDPAANDLTVVPDSSCVPVAAFVRVFCLPFTVAYVAYVEQMSTPATWSALAFSVPHVVCPVTESCPGIDTRPAGDIVKCAVEDVPREEMANRRS